jgi:hypothetical protein
LRHIGGAIGDVTESGVVTLAGAPVSLDFMAGDWTILNADGATVGRSSIALQASGAMLFEERTIGTSARQDLRFANSERVGRTQLFLTSLGQIREFSSQSQTGNWPLVLGGDYQLRDGAIARFRLTLWRETADKSRRLLEVAARLGIRCLITHTKERELRTDRNATRMTVDRPLL